MIELYIKNQLQGDDARDQMSIKKYIDSFAAQPAKENEALLQRCIWEIRTILADGSDEPMDSDRNMLQGGVR